jgi:hypothetical protein
MTTDVHITGYDIDSFPFINQQGKLRTSEVESRYLGRFFYGANDQDWLTHLNVNGSRIYLPNENGIKLTIPGTVGNKHYIIGKQVFYYDPETVLHLSTKVAIAPEPGIKKQWGLANVVNGEVRNGYFLRWTGSKYQFVKLSDASGTLVETYIEPIDWLSPYNGIGDYADKVDFNSGLMVKIEHAWYGGGYAILKMMLDGEYRTIAKFQGSADSDQLPIIGNPNLSVYMGIEALETVGGNASLKHWGIAVGRDGKGGVTGKPNTAWAADIAATTGVWTPVLSIRLKETFSINGATPKPNIYGYLTKLKAKVSGDRRFVMALVKDATLTGASWVNIKDIANVNITDSMVEQDTSATAITAGRIIEINVVAQNTTDVLEVFEEDIIARDSLNQASETLTIAVRPAAGGGVNVTAGLTWREIN